MCRRQPRKFEFSVFGHLRFLFLTYLFDLREKFIDVAIQLEFSNVADWDIFFWPELCRVEDVEVEVILSRERSDTQRQGFSKTLTHLTTFGKCLNAKFPLGVYAFVDCLVQILAMEIRILP